MNTSFFQRAAIVVVMAVPAFSWAQNVNVVVSFAPPPLPVYEQPPLPAEGYIWSPGYWAYEDGDYYWVPGTWVRPPSVGLFWTPGYWAWTNTGYIFNRGYWGPRVGFYGGVNYGYGYTGVGYQGGYWNRGAFYYNRSINNFGNRNVTRVYNKTVINNVTINHVSYNGGNGGINARPNARDQSYARQRHVAPTSAQVQHFQQAVRNQEQRASVNEGRPPIAATDRAGRFDRSTVVPARAAGGPQPERPQPARPDNRRDDRQANRPQDNRANVATPGGSDRQHQNGQRDDAPRRGQELIQDASRPQNGPNGNRVNNVGNDDRARQQFDRGQQDRAQQQQRQQVQQEQQAQQRREQQIQRDQQQSQQRQEQQEQRARQEQQQRDQQSRQRDQQDRQREEQQDRRVQQQQRDQQRAQQVQQHQQQQQQQQQRVQQAQQREQQQQVRQQHEQQRQAAPRERPEQHRPQGEPRQEQRGRE